MTHPNFIILYVDQPLTSADFYSKLLGCQPVEASPTFAMFVLDSGLTLGLWSKHTVQPAALVTGGGAELVFAVADAPQVQATFADWSGRGLSIAQPLTQMDFGLTFVALDPDGHRLRVFAPGA